MNKVTFVVILIVVIVLIVFGVKLAINAYKSNKAVNGGLPSGGSTSVSPIGKTAYANSDSVIVLNSDFSLNKIYSKDDLIGKVDSIQGASYRIGDTTVLIGDVYLK